MLELIGSLIVWWHWVVVGLILLIVELNTGTFLFFGLGVAAMAVGVIDAVWEVPFLYQILLWAAGSVLAVFIWTKWYKSSAASTAGQSNDGWDAEGVVTTEITSSRRGKVMFDLPVLGDTVWDAAASETIPLGRRVRIGDVRGQIIQVEAVPGGTDTKE